MLDRGPWLKLPGRQLGGVGGRWNERVAGEWWEVARRGSLWRTVELDIWQVLLGADWLRGCCLFAWAFCWYNVWRWMVDSCV